MIVSNDSLQQNAVEIPWKELSRLSIGQLRDRFFEVLGYASQSRNRTFLIRKIVWGLQARVEGGLSQGELEAAYRVADEREVSTRLPQVPPAVSEAIQRKTRHTFKSERDARLPLPGSVLVRDYQGRQIRVSVGKDSFEFEGKTYRSLSAIAREITGTAYNGFLFFKLN